MYQLGFLASAVALLSFLTFRFVASVQDDPASVFQRFQDARNQGDADEAMTLVAPNVSYSDGTTCTLEYPCIGTDVMRNDVEVFVSEDAHSSATGKSEMSGAVIRTQLACQSPGRASIGLERTLSDVTIEVRNGHIVSWRSVSVANDPQTDWWLHHRPASGASSS